VLTRVTAGRGSLEADLAAVPSGSWAEVTVSLETPELELDRLIREAAGGRFEVLKVQALFPEGSRAAWENAGPVLSELQPRQVFQQLLEEKSLSEPEVLATFDELLSLHEARQTA
jgi:hypothetical protein